MGVWLIEAGACLAVQSAVEARRDLPHLFQFLLGEDLALAADCLHIGLVSQISAVGGPVVVRAVVDVILFVFHQQVIHRDVLGGMELGRPVEQLLLVIAGGIFGQVLLVDISRSGHQHKAGGQAGVLGQGLHCLEILFHPGFVRLVKAGDQAAAIGKIDAVVLLAQHGTFTDVFDAYPELSRRGN